MDGSAPLACGRILIRFHAFSAFDHDFTRSGAEAGACAVPSLRALKEP
jgi:hypothetical protein